MTTRASRLSSAASQAQATPTQPQPQAKATRPTRGAAAQAAAAADKNTTEPAEEPLKQEADDTPQQSDQDVDVDDDDVDDASDDDLPPVDSRPPQLQPLLHQAALALPSTCMQPPTGSAITPPTGIARFSTMGPHGNTFVTPPTAFSRQISRLASSGGAAGIGMFDNKDWRVSVAVEERINIRRKLREAYFKHCPTYEQLLDTIVAVDEELLFSCSVNRIDYFKSGIDWDSRIQLKRQQLKSAALADSKKRPAEDLTASSVSLLDVAINNSDLQPLNATSSNAPLQLPSVAQLNGGMPPRSPSKEEQPNKKQRSS